MAERVVLAPLLKKKGVGHYLKRDFFLYALLFMPMFYFVLFKYYPMYGVIIAFKDYNIFDGIWASPWVGFDVFAEAFSYGDFWGALWNTLILNGLDLVIGFPIPIILAVVINELRNKYYKRTVQYILYMPHFLSWVIVGGIVLQVCAPTTGLINVFLRSIGLDPIPFLTDGATWVGTYVFVGIWQRSGWGTILYLAAMAGINPELYEAAQVDGAGRLRRIWHITLPGIIPIIIITFILQVGYITMIGFDRPFVLQNPLVMDNADVVSTFVYRVGLQQGHFALATAVGLFQSAIGAIFLLAANWLSEKNGQESMWR